MMQHELGGRWTRGKRRVLLALACGGALLGEVACGAGKPHVDEPVIACDGGTGGGATSGLGVGGRQRGGAGGGEADDD